MSDEGRKRTAVPGFDAREWVELWRKTIAEHPGIPTDDETMLTWFANAIMRGYDEATSHAAGPAEGLPPAESQGAPTASAIRAEGTPQPEPLREALRVAREAIDRDRTGLASALNGVRGITGGYHWLAAGEWASYDYTQHTEATLRTEIANCFDAIEVIAKALKASGALADEHCRKIDRAICASAPAPQATAPILGVCNGHASNADPAEPHPHGNTCLLWQSIRTPQASETPAAEVAADLESEEAAHMETIKRWSAQASDLEALRRELAEARFRPMGDNHHNAAECPYCGDPLRAAQAAIAKLEQEHAPCADRATHLFNETQTLRVRAEQAETTIASLREEVERLRREAALSPPQADAQACKCERRSKGYRHNHGNCPVHPAPSRFPDHNGPGGPVWIEEDDATTTQGGEG